MFSAPTLASTTTPSPYKPGLQEDYGKFPVAFIHNEGQVDKRVKYFERGGGHSTFFTQDGVTLSLRSSSTSPRTESIKLTFFEANPNPEIVAAEPMEEKVNYFVGKDPRKWRTHIPTYGKVVYKEVYPGIDVVFYEGNRQLEYDVVVKPGADPKKIRLGYQGIRGLKVTDRGDMEIALKSGAVIQKRPQIYQEIDGKRVEVAGEFKVLPAGRLAKGPGSRRFGYTFSLADYDPSVPLVIDPTLSYASYLGGGNDDYAYDVAVDAGGNAYVTGTTNSLDFPATLGTYDTTSSTGGDAFIVKINAAGSALVYATYLGGTGFEGGNGIVVDTTGNAYVTGSTSSSDFPTTVGAYDTTFNGYNDVFVVKVDAAGSSLVYATYLGGSGVYDSDIGYGIAVDTSGHAYVTGETDSPTFPTTLGAYDTSYNSGGDAFVAKFDLAGSSLAFATYLGGSNWDQGLDIAVDTDGNAYVAGSTWSVDLPATVGAYDTAYNNNGDGYVVKLDSTGTSLVYATYVGGSDWDDALSIAVDTSRNAYITGDSNSSDFPTTVGAYDTTYSGYWDAFVTKIDTSGSSLAYSTYLGGTGADSGRGIAVDSSGSAFVTGWTWSSDFPTTLGAFDTTFNLGDSYMVQVNTTGTALSYATFVGGIASDSGEGIAVSTSGNVYLAGWTLSIDFPSTSGSFDTTYNSNFDAFVAKFLYQSLFEESDPAVSYTGTWSGYACAGCSGGALNYSTQTGARASFSFTGTGIKWIVTKANMLGKARVYLDGVNMGLVDLYSAATKNHMVLSKTGLAAGNHTVILEVSGQRNPSSAGSAIDLDAFEVVP
jgi:hypothetical protein